MNVQKVKFIVDAICVDVKYFIKKMAKKDKFKEHACEFKNEAECEEELEAEGLNLENVEKEHFEETEEDWKE